MKSYIKFLSRNKLYTAIEAVGLAVSLAFVIVIACFAVQEYGIAYEHRDGDRIYLVGMEDYPGLTFGFGEHIAGVAPEVESLARYCPEIETIVQSGENSVSAKAAATEPAFFEMFPKYRLAAGSPDVLNDKDKILVSRSFATRLGGQDPLGQEISVDGENYVIGGIFEDFKNTVLPEVDIIAALHSQINRYSWEVPYDRYGSTFPFIRLRKDADREELTAKMEKLCKELYPDMYGSAFFMGARLTRMDEIYFSGMPVFNGGDRSRLMLFAGIGLLLLLSAIFNYINLSFALTGMRAREMATRRLVGATKVMIFGKYIAESLLFTAVCTGLALLIALAIAPTLSSLMSHDIRIAFTPGYLAIFLGLIAIVGVICGLVPAVTASRYEPIGVVRGTARTESKRIFSKVFIIFQGALAVFMISMAIVTEAQYRKSLSRPMHSDIENKFFAVYNTSLSPQRALVLKDRLLQIPSVRRVGFTQAVPGTSPGGQYSNTVTGEQILYRIYRMDSTAFSMLAFEKIEDFGAPLRNGAWFGQKAFHATGFTEDYHEVDELRKRTRNISQTAGIIEDFPANSRNMGAEDLLVVVVNDLEDMYYAGVIVETEAKDIQTEKAIRATVDAWNKEKIGTEIEPIVSGYIEDIFLDGLSDSYRQMRLIEIFMAIAVLISLLGLLAMSTWYAGRNARDIAVRKVFGSTIVSETASSVTLYMKFILVSCIAGVPVAVYAAGRYLQEYIYRIENYWWIFAIAVVLSVTAAFLSVLWQTLRAAKTNPAIELKKE